jgi:DNA-binding NarL/FixJ family response regulator
MDIVLGGRTNGIEAARSIQRVIDTSIIFVTGQSDEALVSAAARSGAAGYVVKPFQALQVTSSIKIALHRRNAMRARERPRATPTNAARETRRVAIGRWHREDGQLARGGHESPFTSMVQRLRALLTDEEVWSSDQAAATRALPSGLCITQREREVILGLICYRRLTRVAEVLGISVHTVRNHLKSVFRKLNLHSQDELLEFLLNENQP